MRWLTRIAILLTVTVNTPAQILIRKFDASKKSVTAGMSTTLSWEVDNAAQVSIEPGLGKVKNKDTVTVQPTQNTTYILTATDTNGRTKAARVFITVVPAAPRPAPEPTAPAAESPPPPSRPMDIGHVTGRHLLPPGRSEETGFGLYSYLLLSEGETTRNRDRYLKVIEAVITQISALPELLVHNPDRKRINVLYIPVRRTVDTDEGLSAETARVILSNYDFARARLLLASIDVQYQTGPYFVSRLQPISLQERIQRPYLFQDLSSVSPTLAVDCVKRFLRQAARDDPWNESRAEKFAASLRNDIQILTGFLVPVSWVRAR